MNTIIIIRNEQVEEFIETISNEFDTENSDIFNVRECNFRTVFTIEVKSFEEENWFIQLEETFENEN